MMLTAKHSMNEVKDIEKEWKEKRRHGQHVRGKEGIDWDKSSIVYNMLYTMICITLDHAFIDIQ